MNWDDIFQKNIIFYKKIEIWRYFYQTGNLKSKIYYFNNLRNGIGEFFLDNGQIQTQGFYSNEKRTGKWKSYDNTGSIMSIINYNSGLRDGVSVSFWRNGKIKVRSSYINGILHGRWDSYDKNGNLYSSSICKKGT